MIRRIPIVSALVLSGLMTSHLRAEDAKPISPLRQFHNPAAADQDDFCFWVHPQDPTLSTLIASDKSADALFVYDLSGRLLQQIDVPKPGNIDIRQSVKFPGGPLDVVVVNQRSSYRLRIFRVDSKARQLEPLDPEPVITGTNYGGCLTVSRKTGRLAFLCTAERGVVEQYQLTSDKPGALQGRKIRSWAIGKCEGAVADDDAGAFISEEEKGIWKVGTELDDATPGQVIAKVGEEDHLQGDLEGLTLFRGPMGTGYLIASDQGQSRFVVFERQAPHRQIGAFQVQGAVSTDGIDLATMPLGPEFPEGIFACHTDRGKRAIQLSSWADIRRQLKLTVSAGRARDAAP